MPRFGLFQYTPLHGASNLHPDDVERYGGQMLNGTVFRVDGTQDGFLVLVHGDIRVRGNPELFEEIPPPPFFTGDEVRFTSKGETQRGTVCGVGWHYKREAPMFGIEQNGKRRSKRYFAEDLSPA